MENYNTAFLNHCLNDKHYEKNEISEIDFENLGALKDDSQIIIVKKADWSYEQFSDDLLRLKKTGAPCIVFTDGKRFRHIFVKEQGTKYNDVSDVPESGSSANSESKEKIYKDIYDRTLCLIRDFRRQFVAEDVANIFLLAVEISQNNDWNNFRKALADKQTLTNYVLEKTEKSEYSHLFDTGCILSGYESMESILQFEDGILEKHPEVAASVFLDVFSNRYESCLNPTVVNSMLSFASGKSLIIGGDIGRFALGVKEKDIRECTIQSPSRFVEKARFVCGDKGTQYHEWGITGEYDTVIAVPPFGVPDREHLNYETVYGNRSRDLSSRIIEESMLHLNKGGKLVALMPTKFLFGVPDTPLRNKLMKDYNVTFIQIIKGALIPASSMDTALIIIDNSAPGMVIASTDAIIASEMDFDSQKFREIKTGEKLKEGYFEVDNSFLEDSWVPMKIFMDANESEDAENKILLSEVAKIISGVTVPSSEYLKSDSFGGIPYVRVSDYNSEGINIDKAVRVPGKYAKLLANKGDILFSVTATIGKMAVVTDETFIPGAQSVVIRPLEHYVPERIVKALCTDAVTMQISSMITGNTIRHLSKANLEKIRLDRRDLE